MYRKLFIFLEGDDDERFFERLIRPLYKQIYDDIRIWKYSQETKKKVTGFLNSIYKMRADYIFVADMDDSPCVTAKKKRITSQFKKLSEDRILVVCREIESWYLAGLNDDARRQIKIRRRFNKTDSISKEQFDRMMPQKFVSRIDFMQEIMKLFDRETASTKNTSFEYFMRKYKEERDKRNKKTGELLPGFCLGISKYGVTTDAQIRRGVPFGPLCQ